MIIYISLKAFFLCFDELEGEKTMSNTDISTNINKTKKRTNAKKLSFKLMSAMLGCTMFLSPIKVSAQGIQTRSMDNHVNYMLAGETDGVLDYARTDFTKKIAMEYT